MDQAVIGVDIGSSRIKAIAYDRNGRAMRDVAVPTPLRRHGDVLDFPVLDMVATAREALAAVARGSHVMGIGIASMGEVGTIVSGGSLAAIDFPSWHDSRGDSVIRRLSSLAETLDAHTATGGHFRTVSTVAKLAWLADQRAIDSGMFLTVASALAWTLTGDATQDMSLAVTSGVTNPLNGRHLDELWAAAGLQGILLAPVANAGTAAPIAAERTVEGLLPGSIPVVVAGHDHPVAAVGTGAPRDAVIDSLGTGEPLIAPFAGAHVVRRARVAPFPPEGFSIEASPSTGDPIAIAEGLRPGLAMSALLAASGTSRAELDARVDLDCDTTLDAGDVAALESGVVTIPADHRSWSALHASFVARAADAERAVRELTGVQGPTVLTGGGLRSTAWVKMKQRAASGPVLVSTATETAARGAAALAGVAAQWWDSPEGMPGAALVSVDAWLARSSSGT